MSAAASDPMALSLAPGLRETTGIRAGRREMGLAVPISMLLHGAVIAAVALGWQLGAGAPEDVPMDVIVVMEPAQAEEAPEVQAARAPDMAEQLPMVEPPPPVQVAELKPIEPPPVERMPEPPPIFELPPSEPLPPAVTETAFVLPAPPPPPPIQKPVKKEPPKAAPKPVPPAPPAPPREADLATLAPAAAPPAAEPGPPAPATAPLPDKAAAAPAMSFRGLPLVTDPSFREPPGKPVYPRRAVDLDQKGTVVVRALVDADGNPATVEIWNSSGFPLLDRAAEQAVRKWRFRPATLNTRPTEAWVQVAVHFNLR